MKAVTQLKKDIDKAVIVFHCNAELCLFERLEVIITLLEDELLSKRELLNQLKQWIE